MKFLTWLTMLFLLSTTGMISALYTNHALPLPPMLVVAVREDRNIPFTEAEYYLHNLDEGTAIKMTLPSGRGYRWSVDGRLAFIHDDDLYLQEGQNSPTLLASDTVDDAWSYRWSPDGRLAFVSNHDREEQIYVLERDGILSQITTFPGTKNLYSWLTEDQIAMSSSTRMGRDVGIVDMEGNFEIIPQVVDYSISRSPDGQLAVLRAVNELTVDLQIIDTNNNITTIAEYVLHDAPPVWSVDGRLAWADHTNGGEVMVWDGVNTINVSNHPAFDSYPQWTPDGRLLFSSRRTGNEDIYLWDGQSLYNVTQRPEHDLIVGWWYPS